MTPLFANIRKSDGEVRLINLSTIIEMVPDWNAGTTTLYFANNCLSNGASFDVSPNEITAACLDPTIDENGIIDLLPPAPVVEPEEETEEEAAMESEE